MADFLALGIAIVAWFAVAQWTNYFDRSMLANNGTAKWTVYVLAAPPIIGVAVLFAILWIIVAVLGAAGSTHTVDLHPGDVLRINLKP